MPKFQLDGELPTVNAFRFTVAFDSVKAYNAARGFLQQTPLDGMLLYEEYEGFAEYPVHAKLDCSAKLLRESDRHPAVYANLLAVLALMAGISPRPSADGAASHAARPRGLASMAASAPAMPVPADPVQLKENKLFTRQLASLAPQSPLAAHQPPRDTQVLDLRTRGAHRFEPPALPARTAASAPGPTAEKGGPTGVFP